MRLVVYAGSERIPTPIFNEKVLAGLGAGIEQTGRLAAPAREKALATLQRFKLLIGHMKVKRTHVMATAAIRDAKDGAGFVREIERIGFDCEVLSAQGEAQLAGMGVLSGSPHASGLAGDLGGGSLELVEVSSGGVKGGISLPLGVLRVEADSNGEKAAKKAIKAALKENGLRDRGRGRSFHMVGGSWRALARIDMLTRDYPLPVTHEYRLSPKRVAELRRNATSPDAALAKIIAPARLATAPVAAMLLELLVDEIEPANLIVSTFGIREGLLFSKLKPAVRRLDPLLEEARESGGGEHRFGQHGDLLDEWIGGLFRNEPKMQRLRLAACLLADVAWQASPAFRADRAIEMALHGNWVAVSPTERVIIAQALSSSFGREGLGDSRLLQLCDEKDVRRAHEWGLAMRLGQRLSGGVSSVLKRTELHGGDGLLELHVRAGEEALVGEAVERRLVRLADTVGMRPAVVSA